MKHVRGAFVAGLFVLGAVTFGGCIQMRPIDVSGTWIGLMT